MDSTHDGTHDGPHDGPHDTTPGDAAAATGERVHRAGAFDIRVFIAALLGTYGVVLVLTSVFLTSAEDLEKAGGVDVNLWTGLALLLAAGSFLVWARLRPVLVPADPEGGERSHTDGDGSAPPSR